MKWLLSLIGGASLASAALPATDFSMSDGGKLPCFASGGSLLRTDLVFPADLLRNVTYHDVRIDVPVAFGNTSASACLREFYTRECYGSRVRNKNIENEPVFDLDVNDGTIAIMRMLAAWDSEKTVDEQGRQWGSVQLTASFRWTQPDGNETDTYYVTAPVAVQTSCRFNDLGLLDHVRLPSAHDVTGVTVDSASGHLEIFVCGDSAAGSRSLPYTDVVLQPAQMLDTMLMRYEIQVLDPSTGQYVRETYDNSHFGAVLNDVSFTLNSAQETHLEVHNKLEARVEAYFFTNVTAFEAGNTPAGHTYFLNETMWLVSNRANPLLSAEVAANWLAGRRLQMTRNKDYNYAHEFTFDRVDGESEHVRARYYTRINKPIYYPEYDYDKVVQLQQDPDFCYVTVESMGHAGGEEAVRVYDVDGELQARVPTDYSTEDVDVMRDLYYSEDSDTMLRVLANDWTSEHPRAHMTLSDTERTQLRHECVSCCIAGAVFSKSPAGTPEYFVRVEYELIGNNCYYDNATVQQNRIALTKFRDYTFTGKETPKLYMYSPAMIGDSDYHLTFEFDVDRVRDTGRVDAFVRDNSEGTGQFVQLQSEIQCPAIDDVTDKQRETIEKFCGPLQLKPTTSPTAGAAHAGVAGALVAAAVAAAL